MANSILHLVLQICGTPKPSHKISTLCPSCTSNPTHVTHQLTTTILSKFLYIAKWLNNSLVYSPLSNHFWWTSISTHAQTTQTMIWAIHGQPRKTLNSPPPPTTCAHYTKMTYASTFSPYTQTPPLITWEQPYTTKQHDKYTSYSSTRVTLLMTIDIHLGNPLQNTIPTWLYSCLCIRWPCQCLARLKPNILIIFAISSKKPHTTQPKTWGYIWLNSRYAKIVTPLMLPNMGKTYISTPNRHTRRCQMASNPHYPHNKRPRR